MVESSDSERSDARTDGRPSTDVRGAIGSRVRSAVDANANTVTFVERGSPGHATAAWITVDESLVVDVAEMG